MFRISLGMSVHVLGLATEKAFSLVERHIQSYITNCRYQNVMEFFFIDLRFVLLSTCMYTCHSNIVCVGYMFCNIQMYIHNLVCEYFCNIKPFSCSNRTKEKLNGTGRLTCIAGKCLQKLIYISNYRVNMLT